MQESAERYSCWPKKTLPLANPHKGGYSAPTRVTSLIGGDTISWHLDNLLCRSIDFQSAAALFSVWLRILSPKRELPQLSTDLSDEPVACAAEADVTPPSRRFSGSFGLIKISIDPGSSTGASARAEAHTDETVDVDQCFGPVAVR
jgi:hypothetical protein